MATSLASLTVAQLQRAAEIRAQIDRLTAELDGIVTGAAKRRPGRPPGRPGRPPGKRGKMSAAGRARIAAAQRLRWAKFKAEKRKGR